MIPIHGKQVLSAPIGPCMHGRATGKTPSQRQLEAKSPGFYVLISLCSLLIVNVCVDLYLFCISEGQMCLCAYEHTGDTSV